MEREGKAAPSLSSLVSTSSLLTGESLSAFSQKELFPAQIIAAVGGPQYIQVPDPVRPERRRVIVVASRKMQSLIAVLDRAAPTTGTILLQGESGSGKNLLASFIHSRSPRAAGRFVHFSAGHHPENLIESELFGHEAGAYTGAQSGRPGKFELAHQGTLFIDEVGELTPSAQLKLHRFLDDQVFERIGGTVQKSADVRIIAATHRDLWSLVKEGKFREDLYYRLCVVCVRVPSLRERPDDIAVIATLLLRELSHHHGKAGLSWDPECLDFMSRLPWLGNVRALRNSIENMVILSQGEVLGIADLPKEVLSNCESAPNLAGPSETDRRLQFIAAYERCGGNRSAIAKAFGTSRSQVRRLIERYVRR